MGLDLAALRGIVEKIAYQGVSLDDLTKTFAP